MKFAGTTILKLKDGKIVEEIGLDDGVTALTQLGLVRLSVCFHTLWPIPLERPRSGPMHQGSCGKMRGNLTARDGVSQQRQNPMTGRMTEPNP